MSIPSLALAARANARGGFTYRQSDGTFPEQGFAVSVRGTGKGTERTVRAPVLLADDLDAYWRDHQPTFDAANIVFRGGACLGAWYGPGGWYLDLSIVVRSLDEALTIARQNEQLAVFDLADKCEIAVPYHAPPEDPCTT